ncbi:hypothetical protein [Microcoleus sp. CAWBG58]|nr:hypothetical protein [Microcoleus sp. CAWBG58]
MTVYLGQFENDLYLEVGYVATNNSRPQPGCQRATHPTIYNGDE